MPETTPLIKAALNLRVGAGFDVYVKSGFSTTNHHLHTVIHRSDINRMHALRAFYCHELKSTSDSSEMLEKLLTGIGPVTSALPMRRSTD